MWLILKIFAQNFELILEDADGWGVSLGLTTEDFEEQELVRKINQLVTDHRMFKHSSRESGYYSPAVRAKTKAAHDQIRSLAQSLLRDKVLVLQRQTEGYVTGREAPTVWYACDLSCPSAKKLERVKKSIPGWPATYHGKWRH